MLDDGETDVDPDVAPPVEKLAPVHDVAPVDDHESVDEFPCVTDVGETDTAHVGGAGSTLQVEYAYVPESVPFEHERVCDTQLEPYATLEA